MQYIINQLNLFKLSSFYEENHEFEAVNDEVLYCMKKGMIAIPTGFESIVQIQDVCYVLKTSANLISMGILKRCGWSYLNEGSHMLLTKETSTKETITIKAKLTKQNIYCLVVYRAKEVIMSLHNQGRPTHLMGTTSMQHLWHQRFEHASYARIKLASIIINGLLLDQANELYKATNESASNSEHLSLNNSEHLTPDVESRSAKGKSKSNHTIEPLAALQANGDLMKVCQLCVQSKQTRIIQHTSIRTTKRILEQLHSDL